jgi:hypothetical protein
MLHPDLTNPEAERLFMAVLSLVHSDNRLHIMQLFHMLCILNNQGGNICSSSCNQLKWCYVSI